MSRLFAIPILIAGLLAAPVAVPAVLGQHDAWIAAVVDVPRATTERHHLKRLAGPKGPVWVRDDVVIGIIAACPIWTEPKGEPGVAIKLDQPGRAALAAIWEVGGRLAFVHGERVAAETPIREPITGDVFSIEPVGSADEAASLARLLGRCPAQGVR